MRRKRWSRWSRGRSIMGHIALFWITNIVVLTVVLYNTSTCFDYTEYRTIGTMALFGIGSGVMQYQIWQIRHTTHLKRMIKDERDPDSIPSNKEQLNGTK